MWVCVAAGRSRESVRCTATPRAARWPQRETWWPGAAGCWSLSWKTPLSGNVHTRKTDFPERNLFFEVIVLTRVMTLCVCLFCRRQVNWREAKGEEEINIYQSERRRRTIHSLPKESRVSELTQTHIIVLWEYNYFSPITFLFMTEWLTQDFSLFKIEI